MKKNIIGIIVLVVIAILAIVFLTNKKTTDGLEGSSWVFGESGILLLGDGQYLATAGCNTISGAYTSEGTGINFEDGTSTLMACPDLEEAENNLKNVLSNANAYSVTNDVLVLTGEDVSLELTRVKDASLTNVQWNITSIKEDLGITSAAVDEGTFLTLAADGTFSGKSACNTIMGSYTLEGNNISFSDIASTKMMCDEEANQREQVLVTSLSEVSEYVIEGDKLTLVSEDGEYKIEFLNK